MNDDLFSILRDYPQIYLACHSDHRARRGTKKAAITARDATFLAHIADGATSTPDTLARHLGLARSTVSEALTRLRALGLVTMASAPGDARRRRIALTDGGRRAIVGANVLDEARVGAVLGKLSAAERKAAVRGLHLLAKASRALTEADKNQSRGKT